MIMEEHKSISLDNISIGLIGLGYVGLPLATEFGKKYTTFGFDIDKSRVKDLKKGIDTTNEVEEVDLNQGKLIYTSDIQDLINCNVYIVTVPTPVDKQNAPDLSPLINASKTVGAILKKGDLVIYESTVFPGATEEVCVPILENASGLTFNTEFYCGYSPERINPGDTEHRITDIIKVTSGSNASIAETVDNLYKSIITAGTFKAKNIKTAEAAKVIENTQRDVNIALVNEFSIIFNTLEIDTKDVLDAAETKWNFLPFKPGLVGGHCIGVDPYYLTYRALKSGYKPEMILSGRKLNDSMPAYVANKVLRLMSEEKIDQKKASVLILGFSFKENCPDYRNTKIVDLYLELKKSVDAVDIFDPWVNTKKVMEEHQIRIVSNLGQNKYDAVILAVAHDIFQEYKVEGFKGLTKEKSIIYDIKHFLDTASITARL
tara:strand:+ start:411 stop:1706 length:1296 start_codon:yes stop_codon:yes gene_type:complete